MKLIQEWSSVVSAIFSLGVIGLTVTIVREKLSIHADRLNLAREENEKLQKDVRKVGASLGIDVSYPGRSPRCFRGSKRGAE